MTTLITGGTVVSATGRVAADVLLDGEAIVALVAPGSTALGSDLGTTADTVIDATGKYVIPGGVDCHTHMEMLFGGTSASDTFETGTRGAAWGGTTTIVDFAIQRTGERVQNGLAAWHAKAAGHYAIDYGFHQILGGVDDDALRAMDELVDEGIIAPGADADIVVYDPQGHTSIGLEKTHHMNVDYSAWEGFEIDGHVDTVLSRGRVVVSEGEFRGAAGHGRFVKRGLSQYLH